MLAALLLNLPEEEVGRRPGGFVPEDGKDRIPQEYVPEWAIQEFWARLRRKAKKIPVKKGEEKDYLEEVEVVAEAVAEDITKRSDVPLLFDQTILVIICLLEVRLFELYDAQRAWEELSALKLLEELRRRRNREEEALLVLLMS